MRISDWSSDVCSSDLCVVIHRHPENGCIIVSARWNAEEVHEDEDGDAAAPGWGKVGTFSCDVWRVLALDQQTAVKRMIAGGCSAGDADKILSDYLTSGDVFAENIVHLDAIGSASGREKVC